MWERKLALAPALPPLLAASSPATCRPRLTKKSCSIKDRVYWQNIGQSRTVVVWELIINFAAIAYAVGEMHSVFRQKKLLKFPVKLLRNSTLVYKVALSGSEMAWNCFPITLKNQTVSASSCVWTGVIIFCETAQSLRLLASDLHPTRVWAMGERECSRLCPFGHELSRL